ncbi:hypothetical protein ACHAWF_010003 [Thalassiosira exigua]
MIGSRKEVEQAAKQNRWGSLAARLEAQCGGVLSMGVGDDGSSTANESHQTAQQNKGSGSPSVACGVNHEATLDSLPNVTSQPAVGPVTQSEPSAQNTGGGWGPHGLPYQQRQQHSETIQGLFHSQQSPAAPSGTETTSLKQWIVAKKIDKEIKEATSGSSVPPNFVGISPFEKQRLEECVKLAHLIVARLSKSLERQRDNEKTILGSAFSFDGDADDWEPKPQDIDEDCITVTVRAPTGDVVDVGFDIYKNFDWDNVTEADNDPPSKETRLGLIFEALGKLLFKLFMEGEDVPPPPKITESSRREKNVNSETTPIPNEHDILDMLRKLPVEGTDMRNENYISSFMQRNGNLPMPLCRLVSDLLHTSRVIKGESDSSKIEDVGCCFCSLSDVCADIQQMIDFPDAFLFATVTSRWELVHGNNHMFGRQKELQQLMDTAHRIQSPDGEMMSSQRSTGPSSDLAQTSGRLKEAVMVKGHAGSGKSRLVQEIRKPLQSQGWLFLRCKFGKTVQSDPMSVIALGLDEFFSSNVACVGPETQDVMTGINQGCSCPNSDCPSKVCQRLETAIGLDGMTCLSQHMPGLRRLVGATFAHRRDSLNSINVLQGKIHTSSLFGGLLDTLGAFFPVLFFVDDLQWADVGSLELLSSLISRGASDGDSRTNRMLFVGAYRTDDNPEEQYLMNMIQKVEANSAINTTWISLNGFQLESLNEMVSEALCLPRRKTKSLSQIIHAKTQGFPLFVVEFLDALWTEKLLVHNSADGWEWDVDAIDLKAISKGVAELLAGKLKILPPDILSGVQILSCFGSHVDLDVLEAVKNYDGSSGAILFSALLAAQKGGFVEKAGQIFTFSHYLIQEAAFDLIPTTNRIPLLLKLVSYLIPCCSKERGSAFLFVTVDLVNKIGFDAVSNDPAQCQLFSQLNLKAGKKSMAVTDFSSAVKHFNSGITFLSPNHWRDQYKLSLSLFEHSALALWQDGNNEQAVNQVNQVLSSAKSFEDKLKSYCVFVNVIAIGSLDSAIEKIYSLLRPLGENLDPNLISSQHAVHEFMSTRDLLFGDKKVALLQLSPMMDRMKLMSMKLMSLLVLYYNQQHSFLSGYVACHMIRLSLNYGHCEDTCLALATFSSTLGNRLCDIDEGYGLARTALSLLKFYNTDQLIPQVYGLIYGSVLFWKDPLQSVLDPLLKACRLAFSNGNLEHATFNTIAYLVRSWHAGKRLPLMMNELKAFARKHVSFKRAQCILTAIEPCTQT